MMNGSTIWPAGIRSPTDPELAAALDAWTAVASDDDHAGALAAAVARVAGATRLDVVLTLDGRPVAPDPAVQAVDIDPGLVDAAGPWLPGYLREALLSARARRQGGVHHTTPAMAASLVELLATIRPFAADSTIVDPAVGGGVFLLAVCEALDGDRADRVRQVGGLDIDPLAAATTHASLRLWADGAPVPDDAIRVGDALGDRWPFPPASHVIGNPPFLSQLRNGTLRTEARRAALATRWPEVRGYVDDAAAFLLAGIEHVEAGGVVALVQPSSVLSARDAEPIRRRVGIEAPLRALWTDGGRQFAAAVDTVTVAVQKGAAVGPVQRWRGVPAAAEAVHPPVTAGSWASLLLTDVPIVAPGAFAAGATVADVARVTAGFRDQYYGLRGAVIEASAHPEPGAHPQLITSGLIDPLECRWGEATCRFDKQRWERPLVVLDEVDPSIRGWLDDRLVPKLVLGSQTRIIEAAIDATGSFVPCTPVVTVEPGAGAPSLAHLAVALTSPLLSLLLLQQAAGSALSGDAMRVSSAAIGALPLPPPGPDWDAAAEAVTALDGPPTGDTLVEIGRLAMVAYEIGDRDDVTEWWRSRLRGR